MPDVACRTFGATMKDSAQDQPGADAGPDLDEDEILGLGVHYPVLAESHDVHIVVDQHGHIEQLSKPVGNRKEMPSRHDRRIDRHSVREVDRSGQTDSDPTHFGHWATDFCHEIFEGFGKPGEDLLRAEVDIYLC